MADKAVIHRQPRRTRPQPDGAAASPFVQVHDAAPPSGVVYGRRPDLLPRAGVFHQPIQPGTIVAVALMIVLATIAVTGCVLALVLS